MSAATKKQKKDRKASANKMNLVELVFIVVANVLRSGIIMLPTSIIHPPKGITPC
ncbi:MAG: hypothetical protein WBW08_12625 [Methyloceanibacter sp.]